VLENSQDEVTNIINEDNIHLKFLDPSEIVLNDGWNNLERIAAFEAAEAAIAALASDNTKFANTNESIKANKGSDYGDRKNKQRQKKYHVMSSSDNESPSGSSDHEDSPESADLSNKISADEDMSDEEFSGEDTVEKVSLGETELDE